MIPPLTGSNLTDADKSLQTGDFSTAPSTIARSYWSRRERLRQCVVAAGAENLPDHELLELMLFASNPRAKVESLAAQLLQRFGSLAEVLGANTQPSLPPLDWASPPSPQSSLSANSHSGLCGRNCEIDRSLDHGTS